MKIKNLIFPPKYTRYGKKVMKKTVYLKKIYNFGLKDFFIAVISFVY